MSSPFIANDGWEPSEQEICVAWRVLLVWGGLKRNDLDTDAVIKRMLVAAHNANLTRVTEDTA